MLESMINALALTNERYVYYLDLDSMTVVKNRSTIDDMDVSYLAHAYPDRFLPLPNKKELHTYAIMEEYAKRASAGRREKLLTALKGDRPFMRFKNAAKKLELEEDWLRYRDARFLDIALYWCDRHGVDPAAIETEAPATPLQPPRIEEASTRGGEASVRASTGAEEASYRAAATGTAAAVGANNASLAIVLIESIRVLFRTHDDEGFESVLDQLVASVESFARRGSLS